MRRALLAAVLSAAIGWAIPHAGAATDAPAPAVLHGNIKTKIYHNRQCRFYMCAPCTARFATREEAKQAGYKPCGKCGG